MSRREMHIEILGEAQSMGGQFLSWQRLRARNHRPDGSISREYPIELVQRRNLDAVAVVLWRRRGATVEVFTRTTMRPAAHLRTAEPRPLFFEEIVAGVLEDGERSAAQVRKRAQLEVLEEAGIDVPLRALRPLGPPMFPAPGIVSERVHLCVAEVTGLAQQVPQGDGSPLEEGAKLRWRSLPEVRRALMRGGFPDAKTELGFRRFLEVRR